MSVSIFFRELELDGLNGTMTQVCVRECVRPPLFFLFCFDLVCLDRNVFFQRFLRGMD